MQPPRSILSASLLETSWERSLTRKLQLEPIIYTFLRDHQENSIESYIPVYFSHYQPHTAPISHTFCYSLWIYGHKQNSQTVNLFPDPEHLLVSKRLPVHGARHVWKTICPNHWRPFLAFSGQGSGMLNGLDTSSPAEDLSFLIGQRSILRNTVGVHRQ